MHICTYDMHICIYYMHICKSAEAFSLEACRSLFMIGTQTSFRILSRPPTPPRPALACWNRSTSGLPLFKKTSNFKWFWHFSIVFVGHFTKLNLWRARKWHTYATFQHPQQKMSHENNRKVPKSVQNQILEKHPTFISLINKL